jgi:hypothetical protein
MSDRRAKWTREKHVDITVSLHTTKEASVNETLSSSLLR